MTLRPETVTARPSIEESYQMLMGFISEKGLASFEEINNFIKERKLHFFNPPLFVVDNDPAHPDPHPLDGFLMGQEILGTITIDRNGETIRWTQSPSE